MRITKCQSHQSKCNKQKSKANIQTIKSSSIKTKTRELKDFGQGYSFLPVFKAENDPVKILKNPILSAKMKEEGIQELEQDCISSIRGTKLKFLCRDILKDSPTEFYVVPASTKGRHPEDERFPGTMVKHLKRVFKMSDYAIKRYGLEGRDADIALAAALLHDCPYKFQQDSNGSFSTNPNHAVINAQYIEKKMRASNFDDKTIKSLCAAVGFHFGRFDKHEDKEWYEKFKQYENDPITKIVQEADYYASRTKVIVKI